VAARRAKDETDAQLVGACLTGDEDAWVALVDRYEQLVFAIARDYTDASDVADLFQAIWLQAHNSLPHLRKPASFKPWLISLAQRTCYRWSDRRRRRGDVEIDGVDQLALGETNPRDPEFVERIERDQLVREAVEQLPDRCRELIRLLFFVQPPRPYKEVARRLGLATGSIGFIRGRCLDKLRDALSKLGMS
jgi:RNA polymerase sigma factor (sigma-70 family)